MTKQITRVEREVLHLISEEFLTPTQIAKQRGISHQAVYKTIKRLKDKGFVTKNINEIISIDEDKINPGDVKSLLRQNGCFFCDFTEVIQLHHIKFRSKDGKGDTFNLLPVCPNHHALIHKYGDIDKLAIDNRKRTIRMILKNNKAKLHK